MKFIFLYLGLINLWISRSNGLVNKNHIVRQMEDVQGKMPNRNPQQLETNRETKERSVLYGLYEHGKALKQIPERHEGIIDMGDTRNVIAEKSPAGVYMDNIERLQRIKARSEETDNMHVDHYHPYDDVVASRGFNDKGVLSADDVALKPYGKIIHGNEVKAEKKIDKISKKLRMFEAKDALKLAWENSKNRDHILENKSKNPLYWYYLQRYIGNKDIYPDYDKHQTKTAVEVNLPDKDNPVFNYYSSKHTKTNDENVIQANLRMFHKKKPNENELSDYNYLVNKFSQLHTGSIIKTTTQPPKVNSLELPTSNISKNYSALMEENANRTTIPHEGSDLDFNKTAGFISDTALFNKRNKTKSERGTMKHKGNKFQYKNRVKLNQDNAAINQNNKPKSRRYRTSKSTTDITSTDADFYEMYDEKNTTTPIDSQYFTNSKESTDNGQSDEVEATTQTKKLFKKKGTTEINYAKTAVKSLTTVVDSDDRGPKNIREVLNAESSANGTELLGEDFENNGDAIFFDENGDLISANVTEIGIGLESQNEESQNADNQPLKNNKNDAEETIQDVSEEMVPEVYEMTTANGEIDEETLSQGEEPDDRRTETKISNKSVRDYDDSYMKAETKLNNKSVKFYDYNGKRYIDVI